MLLSTEQLIDQLFDDHLFPKNSTSSIFLKFFFGHSIYFIIAYSQFFVYDFVYKKSFIYRLIVENIMNLFIYLSTVVVWKFYWNTGEIIFEQNLNKLLYFICGHFVSFTIAVSINIVGILTGPGINDFDGDEKLEKTYFNVKYFC